MNIVTVTLNPAFDIHYEVKNFSPYKENYADSVIVAAGGKGVNISRALSRNHIDNTAYIVLGEENAADFVSKLKKHDLNFKVIYCRGRIRENITIHTLQAPETRISLDNFCLSPGIVNRLLKELGRDVDKNTIVSFAGRIPKGLSTDCVMNFLTELRSLGCLLAVDCNSFTLKDLLCIKPWLIKPNEQEIRALTGERIETAEQARVAAIKIHDMGIENVIISMGAKGAGAATDDFSYIIEAPPIKPVSTIGAGDSLIAGFIGAYSQGSDLEECLINAASFGTAACLTEGTEPPRPEDIKRIREEVRVRCYC